MRPDAGIGIGASCVKEIAACHQELHRAAALHEDDFIIIIQFHHLAKVCFRFIEHILENGGAVADFRDAHSGSAEIGQIIFHFFEHFDRHGGRACVKVKYTFHLYPPENTKREDVPWDELLLFSRCHPI